LFTGAVWLHSPSKQLPMFFLGCLSYENLFHHQNVRVIQLINKQTSNK